MSSCRGPNYLTAVEQYRNTLRDCWIDAYAVRLIEGGTPYLEAQWQAERAWYAIPWSTRAAWLGMSNRPVYRVVSDEACA